MGTISIQVPQIGQPDTTEDVKVQNALNTIVAAINGGIDSTNLAATLAQSAAVNQSGQTVKGASIIATSESRTNIAYGLMPTPDQVTGIVLPANGLLRISYQAMWQESVASAARAAIFIGSNQLQVSQNQAPKGPVTQAAYTFGATPAVNMPLITTIGGLACLTTGSGFAADVTTGQVLGVICDSGVMAFEINGAVQNTATGTGFYGGPCEVFLAAGTYSVSVQYKASSGSVTASNRRLYVEAVSFS